MGGWSRGQALGDACPGTSALLAVNLGGHSVPLLGWRFPPESRGHRAESAVGFPPSRAGGGLWGGHRGCPTTGHPMRSSAPLSSPSSSSPGCCRRHQVPRGHVLAPRRDAEPLAIVFGSPGPPLPLPPTARPPGTAERGDASPTPPAALPRPAGDVRALGGCPLVPEEPPGCQPAQGQIGGALGVRLAWTAGQGPSPHQGGSVGLPMLTRWSPKSLLRGSSGWRPASPHHGWCFHLTLDLDAPSPLLGCLFASLNLLLASGWGWSPVPSLLAPVAQQEEEGAVSGTGRMEMGPGGAHGGAQRER